MREIPGTAERDAMGCYPLFCCSDWSQLAEDLQEVGSGLVSLALVTDPLGEYTEENLRHTFKDLIIPFKQHFVVNLTVSPENFVLPHHRRNAQKALREVNVEECANPVSFLDDWTALYNTLIERHGISGIAAFSRESFAGQFTVPGIVAFRAVHDDTTVGMLLWYEQGNRAYYHLGAYSASGYELGASFALFDHSIKYFAQREFEWLSLGSGAGVGKSEGSGLSRFKQGWSTGTRTAYFCGRIFDRTKYQEIVLAKGVPPTNYFPAYRLGEFS